MYFHRKKLIAGAVGATVLLMAGKKTFDLVAPPVGSKTCDFYYPAGADQTVATRITVADDSSVAFLQRGGTVNDASCLNETAVFGIADIRSEGDVANALRFARENGLKVTPSGERHSMGGQSFVRGGLVLDMRNFNGVAVDAERRTVTVQAGATWADAQKALDAVGLSAKAMQSINVFTIGGTLSVNAHGIAHDPGDVAPTVRSVRVLLASGEIVIASPDENAELFRHVIGGYGLFGVILEAELDVVPNELYDWQITYVDYRDFPEFYREHVEGNGNLGLAYARLSVSPSTYLTETAVHTFERVPADAPLPKLEVDGHTALERFVINFSKTGDWGRWVRWELERRLVPSAHACTRNEAMSRKEVCVISRNQKMYDSMGYLKNRLRDTDILQEYFVPREQFVAFVDGLRETVESTGANLLNVTVRNVRRDEITALPYARDDVFGLVLYFNQKLSVADAEALEETTRRLIDLSLGLDGTFYLPYQLYYTREQLEKAYPNVGAFFEVKRRYDPDGLLTNTWYEKYGTKDVVE